MTLLDDPLGGLWDLADAAVNRVTIRVAVTGLSRSGKTVFLTSLLANLLAHGAPGGGRETLPALGAVLGEGFTARLVPPVAETTPVFDYPAKVRAMAEAIPEWPPRTEDIARISVEIVRPRANPLFARLGARRLRLEFLDYPGEWLLDLPLLEQDFASWSATTLARLREAPRAAPCAEFLGFVERFDPAAPADDALIRRGHALYRAALLRLRAELGLRYLQPGRFLCPGPRSDAPFLWFFPAPAAATQAAGSAGTLLRERFEAYKADARATFFDARFLDFDRQLVLVDVLGALHAGRAAFEDTARAIADIAAAFRYGGSNSLWRAARGVSAWVGIGAPLPRRIARVVFVATKADHVPATQRTALTALTGWLVARAGAPPVPTDVRAVASVLSTRDGSATHDGRTLAVVEGVPIDGGPARPFYAGDLPPIPVPDGFWDAPYFELPVFRPPRLNEAERLGVPHLGVDEALISVLGGRLG